MAPKEKRSPAPGSWPLIARGRERVAGLAAKRTCTIPAPWPFSPQVVNELLGWRPKERSTALPPGPFVRLVSGVVNGLLGRRPKERSQALAPGPLIIEPPPVTRTLRTHIHMPHKPTSLHEPCELRKAPKPRGIPHTPHLSSMDSLVARSCSRRRRSPSLDTALLAGFERSRTNAASSPR